MNRSLAATKPAHQTSTRTLRLTPLVALLGACASVLGIEDTFEGPASGADQGGSSEAGNGTSGRGNATNGGSRAEAGETSFAGTDNEGGAGGLGGIGPEGGVGPEGGAGGAPPVLELPVHGRVIDYWGKVLPDVAVQIGEELVTTDAKGEFVIANVPAEYDVSLLIRPVGEDYGWVYQGLTRRDPTLQVYAARERRSGSATLKPTNITLGVNDTISVAIGTPDGSEDQDELGVFVDGTVIYPAWRGAATIQGSAHGLAWTFNAGTKLPTGYLAYDSTLIALAEGSPTTVSLNLTPEAFTTGNVVGTATPASDGDRSNSVFLRFTSNASLQLLEDAPIADPFSYLVPNISGSSVTVAASEGYYAGPLGVAHKDGLSAGNAAVTLDIPAPAEPLSPVGNSGVDANTIFSFKASADNAGAFVVWLENFDFYQTLYVVTSKKQFKLPVVVGGAFKLDPEQVFRWRVETHGDFATVDQMSGPTGFMDSFSNTWQTPTGPRQESGSFTLSGSYPFTTAPE